MNTMTSIETKKIDGIKNRLFYHLPPTAVPIKGPDLNHGFQALFDPESAYRQFVEAIIKRTDSYKVALTDSGRSALYAILTTIKSQSSKNEVILPAYSCPTAAQAVLKAGLYPVFCDVAEDTLGMRRDCLIDLINGKTLAIVPTYLYGIPYDITDLISIGHSLGVAIIEDAAQAFGAEINGKPVGTLGDFGFYSLGRGKCIPTGHGGIVVTGDAFAADLEQTIKWMIPKTSKRDLASLAGYLAYGLVTTPFGWWFIVHSPLNPADAGMDPGKLPPIDPGAFSAVQAGIGASILSRIDTIHAARYQNAQRLTQILSRQRNISRPVIQPDSRPVYLRFPIIAQDKSQADALFHNLSKAGIGVSRSYTRTLPDIFSGQVSRSRDRFPSAEHLADCLLTLPTHRLSKEDIARIEAALTSSVHK